MGALWARLTRPIWLTGRVANSLRLADSDYANKEIGYPLMSVYTKKHDLPTYPEPPGNPIYLVRKPLLTVTPTLP